jgi:hypothetical protein
MEHFVTLFDSVFLPQGLALHASFERHAGAYTLWVLCVDDAAHAVLSQLTLPNVRLLRLRDVETPDLRRVRPQRSRAEYCWTLTPFAPRFVFDADASVDRVTYVDADLWLLRNPAPLFGELNAAGKHVLITDHAFAPEHDKAAANGRFCVQFVVFRRGSSDHVLRWWEERCIESVSADSIDGRFGDQKYLDDWPVRFPREVHVLKHMEWTLAPWNATRFGPDQGVIYHFHGLRLLPDNRVKIADYPLPVSLVERVYDPYLAQLAAAVRVLRASGFEAPVQQRMPTPWARLKRAVARIASPRWRHKARTIRPL